MGRQSRLVSHLSSHFGSAQFEGLAQFQSQTGSIQGEENGVRLTKNSTENETFHLNIIPSQVEVQSAVGASQVVRHSGSSHSVTQSGQSPSRHSDFGLYQPEWTIKT